MVGGRRKIRRKEGEMGRGGSREYF